MAAVVGQWSSGWGPGEGVLLDGFVVGVESGLEEEDGGDASGHFLELLAKAHDASRDARRDDSRKGIPHPRVFLPKSAEAIEKKRVEFLVRAKKCKKAQKSAEESEKKELEYCGE